ncbi:unnamed protein product [Gongylonema pulchrum]|uniref:Very-long-chain 3-oxoacyl-CoA synthase n=1 Tax=Gongylonema pulchrum TaxID=637853 RepID=A0A183ES80_9BILA|nr:unnamed protein product [Gongylonema pulchrum]
MQRQTKGKYGKDGKDRFTYTQALVFVQCAVNMAFAYALRGKSRDNVPGRMYASMAMSYLLAMMASNHALQYIPYPTQRKNVTNFTEKNATDKDGMELSRQKQHKAVLTQ